MAAYVALIAAIFPSIEGSEELDELVEDYPDFLRSLFGIAEGASLTSGPGFLDAELFSFMLPLFVLILAVGSGSRTFAGEEDSGRLELLLAYPLRRRDAVFAKAVPVALEQTRSARAVGDLPDLADVAARVIPSVVNISVQGLERHRSPFPFFLDDGFGVQPTQSAGSGVILDTDGTAACFETADAAAPVFAVSAGAATSTGVRDRPYWNTTVASGMNRIEGGTR